MALALSLQPTLRLSFPEKRRHKLALELTGVMVTVGWLERGRDCGVEVMDETEAQCRLDTPFDLQCRVEGGGGGRGGERREVAVLWFVWRQAHAKTECPASMLRLRCVVPKWGVIQR
jgi:hypothetical protein